MKKLRILLIIFLIVFGLAGLGLLFFNFFVPKASGLLIETTPVSAVYINGEEVGRTPYTSLRKPSEIVLRLIPDSFGTPLSPFEEKINLVSGVETVVRRYFGNSELTTEGEILSFEKLPSKNGTGITIITDPESAQVTINGVSKGTTPYTSQNIEAGVNKIKLNTQGFKDREVEVNIIKGFKLIAFIKLSEIEIPKTPELPRVTSVKMVKILKTPTGFLRVRSAASSSAQEVGRVNEGDEYSYLGEDTQGSWYKISLSEDKMGWVTSQYVQVFTKDAEASESAKSP